MVVRDQTGEFERPWKVKLPGEIRELVSRLQVLQESHEVTVTMESTGTYGEAKAKQKDFVACEPLVVQAPKLRQPNSVLSVPRRT